MARGPLFKGRETGLADDISIINLMPFQQPVADQKLDATCAIDLEQAATVTKSTRNRYTCL